jgi:hypothetical protein
VKVRLAQCGGSRAATSPSWLDCYPPQGGAADGGASSQPPVPPYLGQPYDGSSKSPCSNISNSGEPVRMRTDGFRGQRTITTLGISSVSTSSIVMVSTAVMARWLTR